MKKFKKALAILVAYLMIVSVVPVKSLASNVNAVESIPKYLDYNDMYVSGVALYKDKALLAYGDLDSKIANKVSVFSKGKEDKVIKDYSNGEGYFFVGPDGKSENKGYFEDSIDYKRYIYDFNTGEIVEKKYDGSEIEINQNIDMNEAKKAIEIINSKYGTKYDINNKDDIGFLETFNVNNYTLFRIRLGIVESEFNPANKPLLDYIGGYNGNFNFVDRVSFANRIDSFDYDKSTGRYYMSTSYSYYVDKIIEFNENEILGEYEVRGINKDDDYYIIHEVLKYKGDYYGLCVDNYLYKLKKEGKLYVADESFEYNQKLSNLSYAKDGIYMFEKDGENKYVDTVKEGKLVRLYEVDPSMDKLYVYDQYNMLLSGNKGTTFINLDNSNPEPENPGNSEKPKDNVEVNVPTLKPGQDNEVKVDANKNSNEIRVVLNDIETIKTGKGSVVIKLNDNSEVKFPFSAIDSKLLDGAKNIEVKLNTKKDSEILKGLKAVNSVFNLEAIINKEDGSKVQIHNFANGVAEVTLNLTDDELKGLDKSKLVVFYYNEKDKTFEAMETKVNGNAVTFKTPHFSSFIIAEAKDGKPVNKATVKTGDTQPIVLLASVLVLSGVALVVLKKKHNIEN